MESVYSAVRTGYLTLSLLMSYIYIYIYPRIFTGEFNFKGFTARRLYKSFGVKGLI
jgi:hypothetical protein